MQDEKLDPDVIADLLEAIKEAVGDVLYGVAYDGNTVAVIDNLKLIEDAASKAQGNLHDGPAVSRVVRELRDDLRDLREDEWID